MFMRNKRNDSKIGASQKLKLYNSLSSTSFCDRTIEDTLLKVPHIKQSLIGRDGPVLICGHDYLNSELLELCVHFVEFLQSKVYVGNDKQIGKDIAFVSAPCMLQRALENEIVSRLQENGQNDEADNIYPLWVRVSAWANKNNMGHKRFELRDLPVKCQSQEELLKLLERYMLVMLTELQNYHNEYVDIHVRLYSLEFLFDTPDVTEINVKNK